MSTHNQGQHNPDDPGGGDQPQDTSTTDPALLRPSLSPCGGPQTLSDRDRYELLLRSALPGGGEGIVVLGPGDHLVVDLGKGVSEAAVARMRASVNERFPSVCDRILLIAGAESLAVLPGQQTYDEYRADVSEDADV